MCTSLTELVESCGLNTSLTFFSKPKLVLNMIVKNESKIIERLLQSVLPIIDSYCICDTGSTDNTVEVIETFMKKHSIPGEVYSEPFQNFGYNRTHALERAERWGEYALLLDADMKLVVTPEFNKSQLILDGYSIHQRGGTLIYSNTRFVKTGCGTKCIGPTHEYYSFPEGTKTAHLSTIWIEDIGDGGCKNDKFTRDIKLLSTALEIEPNNCRYHFYLAQSYKDIGDIENSLKHYTRRIELGGWVEEIFYSWLQIGHLWLKKGEKAKAVEAWFDAYNCHPIRSESLYEICKLWRSESKHTSAFLIYQIGSKIPYPKDDVLFIQSDVYKYLWFYEYSILAYYCKLKIDHRAYMKYTWLSNLKHSMLFNYKFYVQKLKELNGINIISFSDSCERFVANRIQHFTSSTPSLLKYEDGYLMNVRYVSYKINDNGSYDYRNEENKITTIQKRVQLNSSFQKLNEEWFDLFEYKELQYQGVEDVKVFDYKNNLYYMGTCQNPSTGTLTIGKGVYSKEGFTSPIFLTSPFNSTCEKNWVDCGLSDGRFIYSWNPLRICRTNETDVIVEKTVQFDEAFFQDVRGSTNGFRFGEELWFLVHIVSHESPRYYYHMIVVLDLNFNLLKYSTLFKFTEISIEYALGLIVEQERIVISYSTYDSTSNIICVPKNLIEKMFL